MGESKMSVLLEKANELPLRPGVYIMKNAVGNVIYVGKSRKLKNRVSQYFQNSEKNVKTANMVRQVNDFDYYVCDTEIEALSLENTLIKQYSPKYNIKLKDAKSYPYIKITDEQYPRLVMTRKRTSDGKYFGPYSGTSTVFSVISTLSSILGIPTCNGKFPRDIGKIRCRDTILALDKLGQKQKVVSAPNTEYDVIALYNDDICSCISVFYVRNGAVSDKSEYVYGADRIIDESSIAAFICEHYHVREYIPRTVLLSFGVEAEEIELISDYLSGLAGRRVTVRIPERGDAKTLCEMVRDNAAERAKNYKSETEKDERVLSRLAEILKLEVYPERIEAYDISNLGSEHITAGMIVTDGTKFKRSDYRSFKIRSVENGTDDYASMREALMRRLSYSGDDNSFASLPDLILLDGGRGHVSVVKELMREMDIDIPVFGMVKDDYHKTRALCTESEEISIAKENALFVFIYKIQEEVHRFTVSKMEGAKRRTLTHSSLTKISGIGDAKAKLLLKAFGGYAGVKNAKYDELAAVKGISTSDAERIIEYFKNSK